MPGYDGVRGRATAVASHYPSCARRHSGHTSRPDEAANNAPKPLVIRLARLYWFLSFHEPISCGAPGAVRVGLWAFSYCCRFGFLAHSVYAEFKLQLARR